MSTMASFGLCSKSTYDSFANLLESSQFDEAKGLIDKITNELENSASKLENDKCSGEVFIALFECFNTVFGIDVRGNMELVETWRKTTGDYDMIAFFEKDKIQFSSLVSTIDCEKVSQFINDFFQNDYGKAGQIACNVFLKNLEKLDTNTVLIFHLF